MLTLNALIGRVNAEGATLKRIFCRALVSGEFAGAVIRRLERAISELRRG